MQAGMCGMPQFEENLASYLSLGSSSLLKAPVLPSKPCQTIMRLEANLLRHLGSICYASRSLIRLSSLMPQFRPPAVFGTVVETVVEKFRDAPHGHLLG